MYRLKRPELLQLKPISRNILFLANILLIAKISLNSAHVDSRLKVRERAKGKCEGCNRSVKYKLIVAHMDHTKPENENCAKNHDYNNPDKLKAYCRVCEFKHHITYMGKAKQIGLSEVNNTGTSNGLWKQILEFEKENTIKYLYSKYRKEISQMYYYCTKNDIQELAKYL